MDIFNIAVMTLLLVSAGNALGEFKTAPAPARPAAQQNPYSGGQNQPWTSHPVATPAPQPVPNAEELLLRKQDMIQVRQTRMQIIQNAIYCIEGAQVPQQLHECQEQERRQTDSIRNR